MGTLGHLGMRSEMLFISLSRLNMFCMTVKLLFEHAFGNTPRDWRGVQCARGFVQHMKAPAVLRVYSGYVLVHVLKHTSEFWSWLCLRLCFPRRCDKYRFDVSQGKCRYLI